MPGAGRPLRLAGAAAVIAALHGDEALPVGQHEASRRRPRWTLPAPAGIAATSRVAVGIDATRVTAP